jgi:hypothetical protein
MTDCGEAKRSVFFLQRSEIQLIEFAGFRGFQDVDPRDKRGRDELNIASIGIRTDFRILNQ